MKMLSLACAGIVTLMSTLGLARPCMKVDVVTEALNVDLVMADLQDYEQRFWAIGLNGDTLQPDGFQKFFIDRDLSFKFFVRSAEGVMVGDGTAYRLNRQVLADYKARIVREEMVAVKNIINQIEDYKQKAWAVGLTGDTLQPDQFIAFFGERMLPIQYYVQSSTVNLGDVSAYEQNLKTLRDYMKRLQDLEGTPDQK